jgi:hypothetical protein
LGQLAKRKWVVGDVNPPREIAKGDGDMEHRFRDAESQRGGWIASQIVVGV